MENTGGDASQLNVKNERHKKVIHNMVISVLLESNKHTNKWCYAEETSSEFHELAGVTG